MSNVTKPIALDESINTTENTPRNIADVLADELSNIADKIQGGSGGSGGHIIQNSQGANLPQRGTMQFVDSHATDNSVGEKTVIENIKSVTQADYPSETEDGLYLIPDGDGSVIEPASEDYVEVTADGVKTRAQLLTDLDALVDWSKVNENSYIVFGNDIYRVNVPNVKIFMTSAISNGHLYNTMFDLNNHISQQFDTTTSTTTLTDNSSNKPSRGRKLTLYYGNKKATVDLQTTANRCLMSNGESVQDYISPIGNHQIEYIPFGKGWNGRAYTFIPLLNANKYTITITSALVYNGGSSAVDITSSVSVGNKTRDGFNIDSSNTYVGECVRLSFTVS